MELKEIREKSKKILANFVEEIGLDGEYYGSLCDAPMTWGNPKSKGLGEFVSPGTERLEGILKSLKCDEKTKKYLNKRGIILINPKQREVDLLLTAVHEMIHSNRNLLLFDAIRDRKNEDAYSYGNSKIDQNTEEYGFSYADASQEILKGNIDTSKKNVEDYADISSEELEEIEFREGKIGSKMQKQYEIDESLVELISLVSNKLYKEKNEGKQTNIWSILEETIDCFSGEESSYGKASIIGEIILRHKDFELFNWIIDPISYSYGDIHYDFFEQYTKNDQDLLQEFYDIAGLDMDEIIQIMYEDFKEVATSTEAIKELQNISNDIKKAKTNDNIEKEIV